jgi:hypothetical protein
MVHWYWWESWSTRIKISPSTTLSTQTDFPPGISAFPCRYRVPSMNNNNISLGQTGHTVLIKRRTMSWMAQAKLLEEVRHSCRNSVGEPHETTLRDIRIWVNNIKDDQKKQYLRVWREFNCLRSGPTGALSKPAQWWSTAHKMWRIS